MEAPPAAPPSIPPPTSAAAAAAAAATANTYADSLDSSPRSRNTDSWEDPAPPPNLHSKLRLMCSYGGTIVPRPHDKALCYVGGETRMVVVDRHTSLVSLQHRLALSLLHGRPFTLKYQLPSEDLDSLISVTTDEDLENMIDEYDRTCASNTTSSKSPRIRLFLFSVNSDGAPPSPHSIGPIISNSAKSDEWFLNALNGAGLLNRGFSDSGATVNCLLGLDDEHQGSVESGARDIEGTGSQKNMNLKQQGNQDVHSVPDSPMLDTTSSFGSTSSSPSVANLPPIRVREDDGSVGDRLRSQQEPKGLGIEEQFAQMTVNSGVQKQPDEAFVVLTSPPPMPTTLVPSAGVPLNSAAVSGEYQNRVFSDDERSDHGAPIGYRKPPTAQSQPQGLPMQNQQKSSGGHDLPSPDSVSSESGISNPMSRQKTLVYQDQVGQIPAGTNRVPANQVDPRANISDLNANARVQMQQQVQDSAYVLQQHQFDQHPQQPQHPQHPQQPQQQQQFIHAGTHYIQQHPAGAMPISYYQVYPSQQQPQHHHHPQIDQQQYPVYYMPARQTQAYNLPVQQQQPSMSEAQTAIPSSRPHNPPPSHTMVPPAAYNQSRAAPIAKPEMAASGGMYRTTNAGAPQLVQMPASQHQQQQYVGYSQIHHPSKSVVPTSATTGAYTYEYADPSHAPIYYTQPLAPGMPSQYQTMTTAPGMVLGDASAQVPTDNMKQQIRTSQPI